MSEPYLNHICSVLQAVPAAAFLSDADLQWRELGEVDSVRARRTNDAGTTDVEKSASFIQSALQHSVLGTVAAQFWSMSWSAVTHSCADHVQRTAPLLAEATDGSTAHFG